MKVAFTTSSGEMIDQHFGQCQSFHIWEIGPEQAEFVTTVSAVTTAEDEEDRILARAQRLLPTVLLSTPCRSAARRGQAGGAKDSSNEDRNCEVGLKETVERLQEVCGAIRRPGCRKAMT